MSEEMSLGPAADLAVVDNEGQAIQVVQPDRGSGSRMPYETYRTVVLLLREGVPVVKVSDRFGVATTTIHEIKARHAEIIPSHKDLMARKSENLREVLSDKMVEAVESGRMSPNQYAFTYGTVSQHYREETGQSSTKSENIHLHLDKNDLGDLLGGLKSGQTDEKSACVDINPPEKQE